MKRMTKKEFFKNYVVGIKNVLRNRTMMYQSIEVTFCPEHRAMDFLLSFKFPCYLVYNKTDDVTMLFMICTGMINLDISGMYNDNEGVMLVFSGNKTVDSDEFIKRLLKNYKFNNLLTEEYYSYRKKLDKEAEESETA